MDLLIKASEFVRNLLHTNLPEGCVYHDIEHTLNVVESAKLIGEHCDLSDEEMEVLLLASWFHDTGIVKQYTGHEEKSIGIFKDFIDKDHLPEEKIEKVIRLIRATKIPHNPQTLLEKIICDADLSHIGKKGFQRRAKLLRQEWENMLGKKYSDIEWINSNIDFLTKNKFNTGYANEIFDEHRKLNIEKLKKKSGIELTGIGNVSSSDKQNFTGKQNITKSKQAERGIETMFRNTIRTHVEFSGLADNKANIMISINTLILTAIVAVMIRKLDTNPHLIIPTAILAAVSLVTLIFAVMVTRPKITSGTFTHEDIKEKRVNLLFFGNFFKMNLKDFEWGMNEMMNDKDFLYGSMTKDFYYLGQVLGQKYRYLRICYNIFMYGIIVSVLAFTAAVILSPGGTSLGPLIE
ncbi:MAG: Pycsar system effector family protein [Ignavibacteriaceae bacterium]